MSNIFDLSSYQSINAVIFTFFSSTGVLVSLHKQKPGHEESSRNILTSRCSHGELNTEALQQVIAAKWAVDVINLQSGPHDLKIGKFCFDIFLTFFSNNMSGIVTEFHSALKLKKKIVQ